MTRTYRIGVLGTGARGEVFARQLHAGSDRATLFGLCDTDPERLAQFADYCGLADVPRWTDPEAFLGEPDFDAVFITTPDFTHADLAVTALGAGKHVYLEKPLAHTLEGCHAIARAQRRSGASLYVGFSMRALPLYRTLKQVVDSGVLGQILHVAGLEQTAQAHGAAFMRRWHRRSACSGGLLNTKCCHDLDMLQWLVGHAHRIVRVASFGGCDVFVPRKAPATHCHACPSDVRQACPYRDRPGFVFPVGGPRPFHKTRDTAIYGGDLCVYNDDKDIVDNQTVLWEWDHGVRGSFNLQLFQHVGRRETRIWGERGLAELQTEPEPLVRVSDSATGNVTEYRYSAAQGRHGSPDPEMLGRFIEAMDRGGASDSGAAEGLAASLLAFKADEARRAGTVVVLRPEDYAGGA